MRSIHMWALVFLCAISGAVNMNFDAKYILDKEQVLYFPEQKGFRLLAAGYDRAIADMLWMRLLAFFGSHYTQPASLGNLGRMLASITDLNPRHESAYYMSAVILPWMTGDLSESRRLTARAMANRPEEGRWAYLMGFNQYLFAGEKKTAAHYLERAIQKGYVNRLTASLATRLKAETAGLQEARAYLLRTLETVNDSKIRQFLRQQLLAVETEMIVQRLDKFVAELALKGVFIDSLQTLKAAGAVWSESLPDGGRLVVDKDGTLFSSANPGRLKLFQSGAAKRLQQRGHQHE